MERTPVTTFGGNRQQTRYSLLRRGAAEPVEPSCATVAGVRGCHLRGPHRGPEGRVGQDLCHLLHHGPRELPDLLTHPRTGPRRLRQPAGSSRGRFSDEAMGARSQPAPINSRPSARHQRSAVSVIESYALAREEKSSRAPCARTSVPFLASSQIALGSHVLSTQRERRPFLSRLRLCRSRARRATSSGVGNRHA